MARTDLFRAKDCRALAIQVAALNRSRPVIYAEGGPCPRVLANILCDEGVASSSFVKLAKVLGVDDWRTLAVPALPVSLSSRVATPVAAGWTTVYSNGSLALMRRVPAKRITRSHMRRRAG